MIVEAENFLDESTSSNAGIPPEVRANLLIEASRFFTLIIRYFYFLFCRIYPSWKIPSHDISKDTVLEACTHSFPKFFMEHWDCSTYSYVFYSHWSLQQAPALHHSFHSLAATSSGLLFKSHFLPHASHTLFHHNQILWSWRKNLFT